jgi:hypothetical protein
MMKVKAFLVCIARNATLKLVTTLALTAAKRSASDK